MITSLGYNKCPNTELWLGTFSTIWGKPVAPGEAVTAVTLLHTPTSCWWGHASTCCSPALRAPMLVAAGSHAVCALCFKNSKLWILLLAPVQSRCLAQCNCFVITERDRQGSPCKYVWRGSGGDTGLSPWLWEGRTGSCPHAHPVLPLYCVHPRRLAASPAGKGRAGKEEGDGCGQAAQVCPSASRPSPSPWKEVL